MTADCTGASGPESEQAHTPAEPDDAELARMLVTATGMGRAQLRDLIERRARERQSNS
ncbi:MULTISPECIES: hypothetical protein [unclassified Actinomyces]|uniref:hypothetical protein n=1 Tax=unclassified Actinomyces TaxID=2609248 RepID=UPI0013A6BA1E|nr:MULTISPECIES: hypothetical protein [unclassified Actinomyces]MBW3070296.1 hypothetical protein [Actinomyces sp. 594]NDR52636.1 hypothetical protein [Actinomyces sp. 565]